MKFRIALAQLNPTVGDLKGNRGKIEAYIDKAKRSAADIIVLPELVLCGSPLEDLSCKPHFIRDNIKALDLIAEGTDGITAVIGFIASNGSGRVRSAAAVINNGSIEDTFYKKDCCNAGEDACCSRTAIFALGDLRFEINIVNGISVSEKEISYDKTRSAADIIFNLCSLPFCVGDRKKIIEYFSKKSQLSGNFNCYINLVGGQDGIVFDGGSFIAAPDGKIAASGPRFEEDIVFFDIDTASFAEVGDKDKQALKKLKLKNKTEERCAVDNVVFKELDRIEEIYNALVLGTRDYLQKNGFEKCVLGLSGGLDSALTAAIATDAIGAGNVTALSMPSQFSSKGTRQDTRKTADNLGIILHEVPIENICSVYHKDIDKVFGEEVSGVSGENLQARVRGNILMAFSNKFGWLVLTTGNKSEAAVGYCTLYGDTAGGFAVICDVLKTTVYELARYINRKKGCELIPESVISRPPSAELSHGQKDTDFLLPYDILDPVLEAYIEERLSFDDINVR
ncbi:MAG: NAD+ synthase, partial [Candidatus Omnitrophica bacterium]|nr:NAD+ synthase [Candidatus Omnitrophota bacterium]